MKKLSIFLFLFIVSPILAAGSRFVIETSGPGTIDGGGVTVKAKIYQDDAKFNVSKLEDVDFKIRNPRDGDTCEQKADKTDDNGVIEAVCYAKQPGSYNVYIKSNDKGDESGEFVLAFGPKPNPTNTPIPTLPTATPTPQFFEEETEPTEVAEPTEEPTPTPEVEVAGFFSKPGNLIAVLVALLSLGALGFLLVKNKIVDISKFMKKKKIQKIDVEGIYPPDEPKQA